MRRAAHVYNWANGCSPQPQMKRSPSLYVACPVGCFGFGYDRIPCFLLGPEFFQDPREVSHGDRWCCVMLHQTTFMSPRSMLENEGNATFFNAEPPSPAP